MPPFAQINEEELRKFFQKHNPEKGDDENVQIVLGRYHGDVDRLNSDLREKYGTDLTSVRTPQQADPERYNALQDTATSSGAETAPAFGLSSGSSIQVKVDKVPQLTDENPSEARGACGLLGC